MGKRTREITIEIEKVRVVCYRSQSFQGWCEGCQKINEFVTEKEAILIAGVSKPQVKTSFAEFLSHTAIMPNGTQLICLKFLLSARSFDDL